MSSKLNNLTVIVNSCDKYDDLWQPFFQLFKKYGGELAKCPIVLNTESKKFAYEGLNIVCPNNYSEDVAWGKRLRDTLKTIKTDYVFFLLDDFFLQSEVDEEVFLNCIKWLDENAKVGAFNFISIEKAKAEHADFKGFCLMPNNLAYRLNAQACIWRKEFLFNSLLDNESPWDWEVLGNVRNSQIYADVEVYSMKYGVRSPYNYNFINYEQSNEDNILVISPVMRGKWAVECIENCFKENNIDIDFSKRGYYYPEKESAFKNFFTKVKKLLNIKKTLANRKAHKLEQERKYNELVTIPVQEHLKKQGEINAKK